MKKLRKSEVWLLFGGDLLIFSLSLWLALWLRTGIRPDWATFETHLVPFSMLFGLWALVFLITGLYEKHTTAFSKQLPGRLFSAQVINTMLAALFFYIYPNFGISPKVILFYNVIISLVLISIWRLYGQRLFGLRFREKAVIFGRGGELASLCSEINQNSRYGLEFVLSFDLDRTMVIDWQKEVVGAINQSGVSVIVIDTQDRELKENLSHFYNLLFARVRFIDINYLYEEVFDRIPLSLVNYDWFLENVALSSRMIYDLFKRFYDLCFSFVFGLLSLILYPFICLAIKLDDRGSIFIIQERVGVYNRPIKIIKFRTMTFNDNGQGAGENNHITKVGGVLRRSRLDEIPQLWNIFKGDLSFIGPRPELPALANLYEKEISYYSVRHLIKPGLSGWAQLYHENHPHHGVNVEETRNKLSYDLYYIKNRSLILDLKIALKTLKTLLSRTGK